MFNIIIVSGIVILIVMLSCYLVHDSEMLKTLTGGAKEKIGKAKITTIKSPRHEFRIANGPVVRVKGPGDVSYTPFELANDVVKIGRSSRNDISLDDDTVENTHIRIEKKMKGNNVYYELINLSKRNPAEILNQETSDFEYLGYRKGIILGDSEVFYVGNTKFIFKMPMSHHRVSKTDRLVIDKGDTGCTEVLSQGTIAINK